MSFPSGTLQLDPTSTMHSLHNIGDLVTDQSPVLHGIPQFGTPFYDASQHRWVPASAAQSSPDGTAYAYGTLDAVHVVSVAQGTEKVFNVTLAGGGLVLSVADFDGSGVYFLITSPKGYPALVWRLDVASGAVDVVARVAAVVAVRSGIAWIGAVNPSDPSPPSVPQRGWPLYDSIIRVDISTGVQTPWYYSPGHSVVFRGFDSVGHPVLSVSSAPDYFLEAGEFRLVSAPGTGGELIYSGGPWLTVPQGDGDRLWFGVFSSNPGIYLYTAATGLQRVVDFGNAPTADAAPAIIPVGFCR